MNFARTPTQNKEVMFNQQSTFPPKGMMMKNPMDFQGGLQPRMFPMMMPRMPMNMGPQQNMMMP
jgi:hypothetical protein